MQFVPVFLTPNIDGVWLKPITGGHYMQLVNTGTQAAIQLLQSLVSNEQPLAIKQLVSADRDRILAHLYQQEYGSKIESTIACTNCKLKFDIDFSLPDLIESKQLQQEREINGNYSLNDATVFRLPTGDDELFAMQSPSQMVERLLQRCISAAVPQEESVLVQEKMAAIAPMLQMNISAVCVECSAQNEVVFDMQQFLLTRMLQEQQIIVADVHLLASHYHWGNAIISP